MVNSRSPSMLVFEYKSMIEYVGCCYFLGLGVERER